jgi:hypothetical protein
MPANAPEHKTQDDLKGLHVRASEDFLTQLSIYCAEQKTTRRDVVLTAVGRQIGYSPRAKRKQ